MAAKTFLNTALTISLFFVVFAVSEAAHAKNIYVDDNGPADFSNIQAAIDDANDGDIIIVKPGTYTGDGNRDIDFKGKAITVRSTDPNNPNIVAATVIDCQGSDEDYHRGFYFRSGEDENSILEGLKITNGFHSTGAGICCRESSPTIRNNIITGNEIGYDWDGGAGIGCWYGASPTIANNIISDNICAPGGGGGGIRCYDRCSPAITNCTISRNSPQGINIHNGKPTISNCIFEGNLGGGISSSYFSSPFFINCTFIGNSSPAGGGMRIYESNPTLINCSFIKNVAATHGGGIYSSVTASPTLINCTFAGNSAANYGGGIYNRDSTNPTLVNCTFTGNSAGDAGGAVYNYGYNGGVRITLNNCTFSGNSAANGNDLACDSPYGPPSYVQATNCVIWDGENPIWNNDGSTVTITYSDVHGGWPGKGNIDADTCFVDPDGDDDILGTEDDNLRLLPDSLCIDAGDPNYIAGPNETDLDGGPRIIGGRIDMGAYEFQSHLILYVDTDATGANDGSSWTDAFNFLQDALATAYYGDEIRVAQGIYKPDQGAGITPGDRAATFQLINGVTLKGGYAGFGEKDPDARDIDLYETILSGDLAGNDGPDFSNNDENSYHVVTGSDTDETAVLDGCIVTAGNANGPYANGIDYSDGGGMYNDDGCPTLTNCTFRFNTASNLSYGGAMANKYSKPTLTGCIFIGNQAEIGGAIYNYVSQVTLTDCTFIENSARSGGAIVGHGYLELTNCKFIRNSAGYAGGAINATAMTLNNCLFSENTADYGGAIGVADRSYATLTDCTFSSNSAGNGGAIWMFDAGEGATLKNCTFTENSAYTGGGIHNSSYSSPTLINCTFTANSAEYGGAIQNKRSDPILSHCTFKANTAGNYGGAIVNENQSAPILDYCTFIANTAHTAGGAIISEQENTLILINNSIFAGNSARWGGAILNDDCDQILTGCTFTGNIARIQYSGIIENDENRVVLTNCIFWENLDMYGQITKNPFAGSADIMTVNYCCVQGWTGQYHGTGNIDHDPCFAELGNWDANATPEDANDDFWVDGDYHLLAGSLCIDAGDPNYVAEPNETDLDGKPRVIGGRIDMGAYEYRFVISAEVRILPQTINLASKGNWITCYIWLPKKYDIADIDPGSIVLENEIQPVQFSVDEQSQLMTARFAREDVQTILGVGDIDLKITGRLTDGTQFEGMDTIKVVDKAGKN